MTPESESNCDCLIGTDGYLCPTHLEEERLVANFGGHPELGDEEVDLPW